MPQGYGVWKEMSIVDHNGYYASAGDLVLDVLLEAVGVFAIAAVVGAHAGLDVTHVPGFWPQHAQHGGRVHRASADLDVVGVPDQAVVFGPKVVQL